MSWQCTSWALREAECPTATARLVLIALADRCQPDGRSAWPSVQTLMAEAHTSEASVRRALRDLEAVGTIRRGNQELARWDERGRYLPAQYRPVVWECCIGAPLEDVAQKPGKQARIERAQRAGQYKQDEQGDNDARGVKMIPLENEGDDVNSSGINLIPLEGQGCQNDTSRPVTGDTSIYVTNIKTNNKPPIVPLAASRTSPEGQDLDEEISSVEVGAVDDGDVQLVVDRLADLRTQAGLSVGQTRRDVDAVQGLLAVHPVSRVLDMLDWVYTKQSSRWWVKRTRTAAAFAKVFDELEDARKLDEQASGGKSLQAGVSVVERHESQRQERASQLLASAGESARVCRFAEPLLQKLLNDGVGETEALQAALAQARVLADRESCQARERLLDDLYERAGMQWVSLTHPESSIRVLAGDGKLQDCLSQWQQTVGRKDFAGWIGSQLAQQSHKSVTLQDLARNASLLRQMVQCMVDGQGDRR